MKISLNWLTDYVDITVSAKELGERMTNVGVNCDAIDESGGDIVFTFDVTSNRPDWLGHVGMAREVSAATGANFHPPVLKNPPGKGNVADLTSVEVLDAQLCPRYTARLIRGVKVGPSPEWLVERLAAVGMRSINNIVDVTNFVLLEYSQPLHSFDFDKLAGGRIVVRRAQDGEIMTAIDGTKCKLDSNMLVIADAQKPVAIAGIMGGLDSEVGAATVNVLIESAQFDPLNTRRTSRKLGLMSESNYRFERGVDVVALERASMRACELILELAGGELVGGIVDVWAKPYVAPQVALRPERTSAIMGFDIPAGRQVELLKRLGLSPRLEGGRIVCTVPSFRRDIQREIDLVEEVARLEGYDKIPMGSKVTHSVKAEPLPQRTRKQVTSLLTACGYDEAVTFTFVDRPEAEAFCDQPPLNVDPVNRKTNNVLRPSLLPSLLRACKINQDAGTTDVSLFEISAVFPPGGESGLPREYTQVGLVTTGDLHDLHDLRDLRGAIETLIARVCLGTKLEIVESDIKGFAAGAAAKVMLDGQEIGGLGMIDAKVRHDLGLESEIAGGWVSFNVLLEKAGRVAVYQPVPRFPAVKRDLSLIVDESVTWKQLQQAIESVRQPMRAGLDYVTTYRGKPIPAGRKSMTATLVYRASEGTLRSEQVDAEVAQVVEALKKSLGAELRV
jgi:phenylalanyl-tRNA synthetase beta chain